MAYPQTYSPLALVGVADAKVANAERVIIRPMELVDLSEYGICVGFLARDQRVYPLNDNVFWFPKVVVAPPSYVFVYTGVGTQARTTVEGTGEDALVFHWGRATTVFNVPQLLPILVRREILAVGSQI